MSELKERSEHTILIVDDNALNRKTASMCLRKQGYQVKVTESGYDALDILKSEPIALVFLDISMPIISGYDTAELIRKLPAPANEVHIVALSATIDPRVKEQLKPFGVTDFIEKPYHIQTLVQFVEFALGYSDQEVQTSAGIGETASPMLLDPVIIEQMSQDFPSGMLLKFLDKLNHGFEPSIEKIYTAFDAQDRVVVKREAHTLKGTLGQLGMGAARETAYVLEREAETVDRGRLDALVNRLRKLHDESQMLIRRRYC